jgi:hypothetical protein
MFFHNMPEEDLHSRSKLVARQQTIAKCVLCVTGKIDTNYERDSSCIDVYGILFWVLLLLGAGPSSRAV